MLQDERARTGHRLKDIFTTYIFAFLIEGLEVVPHVTWHEQQHIINFKKSHISIGDMNTVKINLPVEHWDGISFETLQDIVEQISTGPANTIYVLTDVIRVHPVQLTEWYTDGLLKRDIFIDRFLPTLHDLYYRDKNTTINNQLSIHIRRGDIADPGGPWYNHQNMLWSVDHYQEQIERFKQNKPGVKIKIYSEKSNSSDLLELTKHKDIELKLGNVKTLKTDTHEMVCSEYFMPSNSSLSTWIAYITTGRLILPEHKTIKHFHKKIIW